MTKEENDYSKYLESYNRDLKKQIKENIQIVVPFDADVGYIFEAMKISEHPLDSQLWMITNPMSKEIFWDPNATNPTFKDPNASLQGDLKINSNDIIALTPLGKAKEESEIKKYNIIVTYISSI